MSSLEFGKSGPEGLRGIGSDWRSVGEDARNGRSLGEEMFEQADGILKLLDEIGGLDDASPEDFQDRDETNKKIGLTVLEAVNNTSANDDKASEIELLKNSLDKIFG